jgi:hypothetical protein
MTFSVPEIEDLKARASTIASFGEFSTADFALTGLKGDPRLVHAGVVDGAFFDVMGLRPMLGRLITPHDDGPNAAGVAVLTYRFWTTTLSGDPNVIGKQIGLGSRTATIIGVLEPSVPYPADTEIIANVVTSPHHLGALMKTNRSHRMTELFGRLKTDVTLENARAELTAAHTAMMRANADAYSPRAHVQLSVTRLRDQIASPARTVLLVLLAAAAVVFVIAVSNVANLILARSVRREGELAIRGGARCRHGSAAPHPPCRKRRVVRTRGDIRGLAGGAVRPARRQLCCALLGARGRYHGRPERALGRHRTGIGRVASSCIRAAVAGRQFPRGPRAGQRRPAAHAIDDPAPPCVCDGADCLLLRPAGGRRNARRDARTNAAGAQRL